MAGSVRLQKTLFPVLTILLAVAVSCTSGRSEEESLFERACGTCHPSRNALAKKKTLEEWQRTVNAMRVRGGNFTEEEGRIIAAYLYSVCPAK